MRPMTALPALFSLSLVALATLSLAGPAAAQDATACTNEVQRLSDGFPAGAPTGDIAEEPGMREGARISANQQHQVRDLIQQAHTAGQNGNGALCLRHLNQARTLLRQTGVGAPWAGDAIIPTASTSPGGSGVPTPDQSTLQNAPHLQGTDQRGLSLGTTGVTPSSPNLQGTQMTPEQRHLSLGTMGAAPAASDLQGTQPSPGQRSLSTGGAGFAPGAAGNPSLSGIGAPFGTPGNPPLSGIGAPRTFAAPGTGGNPPLSGIGAPNAQGALPPVAPTLRPLDSAFNPIDSTVSPSGIGGSALRGTNSGPGIGGGIRPSTGSRLHSSPSGGSGSHGGGHGR